MQRKTELGRLSETKLLSVFHELGYVVSIPFGDHTRYDLIVDTGAELWKIQVKTAWMSGPSLIFKTSSKTTEDGESVEKGYGEEVDYFGVYSPDTGRCYLFPAGSAAVGSQYLRVAPLSHQQSNYKVKWAEKYEIGPVM